MKHSLCPPAPAVSGFGSAHPAFLPLAAALVCFLLLAASPAHAQKHALSGTATWYGTTSHGKLTANGEVFNRYNLTAAHLTLPFGTVLRVHNLRNGTNTLVRVTDRGPFGKGRVVDMSYRSAQMLHMTHDGVAPVSIEIVAEADGRPLDPNNSFYVHLASERQFQKAHATSYDLQSLTGMPIRALMPLHGEGAEFMLCAGPFESFPEAEAAFLKVEKTRPALGIVEAPTTKNETPLYALPEVPLRKSPQFAPKPVQASR